MQEGSAIHEEASRQRASADDAIKVIGVIEFGARFKDGGRAKFDVVGSSLEIVGLRAQLEPAALFMRIPLWDPDAWLSRHRRAIDRVYSVPARWLALAVFAMLSDKDVAGVIAVLKPLVAQWFVAGLSGPRGGTAEALAEKLAAAGVTAVACFADVEAALKAARDVAGVDDKIIVFGSFYTVSEAMQAVQKLQTRPLKT